MRFSKKSLITRIKEGDYTDKEISVMFLGINEIVCKIDLT
jgi:hypothetical protein